MRRRLCLLSLILPLLLQWGLAAGHCLTMATRLAGLDALRLPLCLVAPGEASAQGAWDDGPAVPGSEPAAMGICVACPQVPVGNPPPVPALPAYGMPASPRASPWPTGLAIAALPPVAHQPRAPPLPG